MLAISELQKQAFKNENEKGWYAPGQDDTIIPQKLMLIVTEVAEAMEDFRVRAMGTVISDEGKPEGFPTELADIMIRTAGLAARLGIDLEKEVSQKLAFNRTRSYRHGNKRA